MYCLAVILIAIRLDCWNVGLDRTNDKIFLWMCLSEKFKFIQKRAVTIKKNVPLLQHMQINKFLIPQINKLDKPINYTYIVRKKHNKEYMIYI